MRLKIALLLLSILMLSLFANAQKFLANGKTINDFSNQYKIDSIPIEVKGLPSQINASFGLGKIGIDILHTRVSDLKIELLAPDGTSIWITNRNGRDTGQNYLNTSFRSNGFNGYIHEANAPFAGEYTPDGRIEFLNNGQNPNGIWYLLVQDLRAGDIGTLYYTYLEFETNPTPILFNGKCKIDNAAGCVSSKGFPDSVLLPDLIMIPSFSEKQIQEYKWSDAYYPGQLRFAATMGNVGEGPLEIFGKNEWYCGDTPVKDSTVACANHDHVRQKIYQNVYYKQGDSLVKKERFAGYNYFDRKPGHNHFHVEDWVEFRLMKYMFNKQGKVKSKALVSKGRKETYCLFDSGTCSERDGYCITNNQVFTEKNLINYGLGTYSGCQSHFQGLSVGGYDTYGMMFEGQFLNLPLGLVDGDYYLEMEIDPQHYYSEKDHANNIYSQKVSISLQTKK